MLKVTSGPVENQHKSLLGGEQAKERRVTVRKLVNDYKTRNDSEQIVLSHILEQGCLT